MGISEANFSGKLTIENEDRVAGSKHHHVELEVTKDNLAMNAQTAVPFVDSNIIPDRNVGIGSLLRDLQNSQDPQQFERLCRRTRHPNFDSTREQCGQCSEHRR